MGLKNILDFFDEIKRLASENGLETIINADDIKRVFTIKLYDEQQIRGSIRIEYERIYGFDLPKDLAKEYFDKLVSELKEKPDDKTNTTEY